MPGSGKAKGRNVTGGREQKQKEGGKKFKRTGNTKGVLRSARASLLGVFHLGLQITADQQTMGICFGELLKFILSHMNSNP